jgi:uncharacterized radical SAM superfamily Fe-S cluster-containing enzyme
VLREDGKLIATTHFGRTQQASIKDAAERSKEYVKRHWKYYESKPSGARDNRQADPADFLERLRSHSLCISGMAFQDAWNIDLERLQRCCIHVITKSKKLIPFCAYYLTDSRGRRLTDWKDCLC